MVDAPDSKSGSLRGVRVRVPPPVLTKSPAKPRITAGIARGPSLVPGLFYTNRYTNALGKGILVQRGGALRFDGIQYGGRLHG